MTQIRFVMALLVLCSGMAYAADDPAPKADEGLPLAVYQKLKAHFDALYSPRVTQLPGVKKKDRKELEKDLTEDVNANKDVLIKALGKGTPLHRELAASALGYCTDKKPAVEALCKGLEDADENVRRASAASLSKLPDAIAVDALIKALADANDAVRSISCAALGSIKDSRATEPLLHVIAKDDKPMVRMQAATALSKIKDSGATPEQLKQLMDNEKDERVKMAIAGAIRSVMAKAGDEAKPDEGMPTVGEAAEALNTLAREMKEVEEKLRDDRHDQAVQAQGAGIEQKLAELIEKMSKGQGQGQGEGQGEKKGEKPGPPKPGKGSGQGGGSNPLADSKPSGGPPPGALNAAQVAGKQDDWSKLPPALREALTQQYAGDLPTKWQNRLKAYFESVAAEEVKDQK
jgi:hypothetical protein